MIFRFIPGGSGERLSPVCPEANALLVKTKEWGMFLEIDKQYSFSFLGSLFKHLVIKRRWQWQHGNRLNTTAFEPWGGSPQSCLSLGTDPAFMIFFFGGQKKKNPLTSRGTISTSPNSRQSDFASLEPNENQDYSKEGLLFEKRKTALKR